MKQYKTLCQLLISNLDMPAFALAEALDISSTSLSKHASGNLRKPSVLHKISAYLTNLIGGEISITADHLLTPLSPRLLVKASEFALRNHLKEAK